VVVVDRGEKEVLLVLPTLQERQASRSTVRVPVRQRVLPMMIQTLRQRVLPTMIQTLRPWLVVGWPWKVVEEVPVTPAVEQEAAPPKPRQKQGSKGKGMKKPRPGEAQEKQRVAENLPLPRVGMKKGRRREEGRVRGALWLWLGRVGREERKERGGD
jgi:hypothetical protein